MSAISPDGVSYQGVSYQDWIGRRFEARDAITPRLAAEFAATFAPHLATPPQGLFWTLAPEIEPAAHLGGDAHPRLGLYLPPLPFARRMWAGGELTLDGDLAVGEEMVKTSEIASIAFKSGGAGPLAFVAVQRSYAVDGAVRIAERQDIVYRAPASAPTSAAARPSAAEPVQALAAFAVEATPTLLFRYSAMTFNGHRIHYDAPYATGVEGYDGLVVHGPMQATLMLNAAAKALGRAPRRFAYRGLSPLIAGAPFRVEAFAGRDGLETRVVSAAGVATMSGRAA